MTAPPGAGTTPAGPSSGGPWYPPVPSLAALPVDPSKTTPKPAYYKLQFGDDYTGFSYYVRTLNVVIGRNCERVVPPPEQLEQGVPTNPPLGGDDDLPSGVGLGGGIEEVFGAHDSWAPAESMEDVKPTDGLDLSILGDDILDQFANHQNLSSTSVPADPATSNTLDFPPPTEDVKPIIPTSSPRAHTTPPESHPHTHLNGTSPSIPPPLSAPASSHLPLEPESYFDPLFAPAAPPPPPKKSTGPVDHVDVDLGPLKSVSRNHARIEYNNELGHFCLEILGRNGAWVDDRYFVKGSTVPLNQGSQIQIATRIFSFILPPSADPSPYSPYGHEDTANPLEDVPYPYNLPPGEVGYAEFYGEPGPGPSSVANMGGRIPAAFNVFAGTDGLAMGIEGAEGKVWDDEWDNSDEDDEDDSDSDEDDSDEEDYDEDEDADEPEEEVSHVPLPKVRIRLKTDGGTATPDKGSVDGDGDSEMSAEDKKKGNKKATTKEAQPSPEEVKPGTGKAGQTTAKAAKKKAAAAAKADDTAASGMDVDPPAPAPHSEAPAPTAPKLKKENPPSKKKQSKKKKAEPVPIESKPAVDESDVTEPMVATLAAALAENPAPPPPPQVRPPPPAAPSTGAPNQSAGKPMPAANGTRVAATSNATGPSGATNPQVRPMPPRPGQPVQQAQQGQLNQQGQAVRPPLGAPQIRPPQAAVPPQVQKATVNPSPAPSPTRQNSTSSAPPEPPKPFFLTELIETPGQPGHIVVNVPIPPSGAGPRPPPGPLIGLDGKPFIGPPPIKPTATFATIIHRALLHLPRGRGTLGEVCNWVAGEWEWFRLNIDAGWQNSIRHNLSLNKAFLKVPRIPEDDPESKGSVWIIDPEEGPLFEEKQRRDAMKSAGKEKNAEVRRERERQKVEERARKQREMAIEAHSSHGPHASPHTLASQAKSVLPRPAPVPPRPVQRAQAPTAVSANAKGLLQPKAKIQVSIQTLTPAHRAKSVIATTDSSGNPLPFACDGTTLTLDQATFGHLTGDIIDKLTLLGAAGAVDVLSAWVINKNKNQAARAAQQAAAAQASTKPTAASIKAGLTAPRNGTTPTPTPAAAPAKPVVKKPAPAPASGQKFGPAPPGATLTKVIGMIAEVANAKGDVNTVGPNAGALLRYIRVVGVDLDLRVAERIWVTGVVPPVLAKKGAQGAKPNGTAGAPKPAGGTAGVKPPGTATAQIPSKAPVQPAAAKAGPPPVQPPPTGQAASSAGGPLAPSLAAGGNATVTPKPPVGGAPNLLATGGPGVKRKLEDGAAEGDDAKKPKVEAAS